MQPMRSRDHTPKGDPPTSNPMDDTLADDPNTLSTTRFDEHLHHLEPFHPDITNNISRKYRMGDLIAEGGMGKVVNVEDTNCRREIAMKVILSGKVHSDELVRRFIQEAQVTAQLDHPNIVPIYELGVNVDGDLYYTMKKIAGTTLKQVLNDLSRGDERTIAKYTLPVLLTIFQKVCDAVAYAHSKGVIHRDLKPSNIMIGDYGEVLVVDWGLLKVLQKSDFDDQSLTPRRSEKAATATTTRVTLSSSASSLPENVHFTVSERDLDTILTIDGDVLGTPSYIPPEQARGDTETVSERSDIYALGAILYSILTLRLPVNGINARDTLRRVIRGDILAPTKLYTGASPRTLPHCPRHRVPPSLSAVAMKAMATSPAERYRFVQDVQQEIEKYLGGFATAAEDAGALRLIALLVRRHRLIFAILLVLCVTSLGFMWKITDSEKRAVTNAEIAMRSADLARQAERTAQQRYAESLIAKGDAFTLLDQWDQARDNYLEAYKQLKSLRQDTFAVELGLWDVTRSVPTHLVSYTGHKRIPLCAAVSPDGRTVVSAERTVRIWDALTARSLPASIDVGDQWITSVALSPDGRTTITGTMNGVVAVTGSDDVPSWSSGDHTSWITALAVSAGGDRLASSDGDGRIMLWDLAAGKVLYVLNEHRDTVHCLAFSADGRRLVSGGADRRLLLWDVETTSLVNEWTGHRDAVRAVVFGKHDIGVITGSDDGTVREWPGAGGHGKILASIEQAIRNVWLSPDGGSVYFVSPDAALYRWTAERVSKLMSGRRHLTVLAVSPPNGLLAAGDEDGRVHLIPIEPEPCRVALPALSGAVLDAVRDRYRDMIVAVDRANDIVFCDVPTGRRLRTMRLPAPPLHAVRCVPNADAVFGAGADAIYWYDLRTGERHGRFSRNDEVVSSLDVSTDGRLVLAGYADGAVGLWQPGGSSDCRMLLDQGAYIRHVRLSSDGREAVCVNQKGQVTVWDTAAGTQRYQISLEGCSSIVFSPDNTLLLAGNREGTVLLYDNRTGTRRLDFGGHVGPVHAVAVGSDGRVGVSGGRDGLVKIWSLESGAELRSYRGHSGAVTSIAFVDSDRYLVTGGDAGGLVYWDFSRPVRYLSSQPSLAQAIQNLSRAPGDADAMLHLADWYAYRRRWRWAGEMYDRARTQGRTPESLVLGRCNWMTGALPDALAEIEKSGAANQVLRFYSNCLAGSIKDDLTRSAR